MAQSNEEGEGECAQKYIILSFSPPFLFFTFIVICWLESRRAEWPSGTRLH